jgi:hypothetical protein
MYTRAGRVDTEVSSWSRTALDFLADGRYEKLGSEFEFLKDD